MLNGLMKILALGVLAIGVPFTTLAMAHKVCPPGNPFCTRVPKGLSLLLQVGSPSYPWWYGRSVLRSERFWACLRVWNARLEQAR